MHRTIGIVSIAACCLGSMTVGANAECVQQWSPVGQGFSGVVRALAVFDDGGGPALYAGGTFNGNVNLMKWDGKSWTGIATPESFLIFTMTVHDDGTGPALYFGDLSVWKFDGKTFTELPGLAGTRRALASHDDGTGPALYAGVGMSGNGAYVQRWSPEKSAWTPVGSGNWTTSGCLGPPLALWQSGVYALHVFDHDGNGPEPKSLLASGYFITAAGSSAGPHVARWDGTNWVSIGAWGSNRGTAFVTDGANSAADGSETLYAARLFVGCDGGSAFQVNRFDPSSTTWPMIGGQGGSLGPRVFALEMFDDDGAGPRSSRLYAGGYYLNSGGFGPPAHNCIANLTGSIWSVPAGGIGGANGDLVHALTVFDDGSGPALFAAGGFPIAGGAPANGIAKLSLLPCCAADIDASQNGAVDVDDLLVVINQWGASGGTADITVDGDVDVDDLIAVINAWGPCR